MRSFPKTVCAGTAILAVMSVLANAVAQGPDVPPAPANVVWNSPSTGANGSMPLGNGEVGVNLWVERDGDLLFYIARTDAWSECCQLLKLGRVRVSMVPNPFAAGVPYRQTLDLRNGCVDISAGSVSLRVFVDAQLPVVYVTCHSTKPVRRERRSGYGERRGGTCGPRRRIFPTTTPEAGRCAGAIRSQGCRGMGIGR